MKFLQYLFLVVITLLGVNQLSAQKTDSLTTETRAYFEYVKGKKCINLDGQLYQPISPSVFVNGRDTLEKFQHPLGKNKPVLQREGYTLVAIIWEPLAFRKAECTSKQIVDLYRKKKMTPKDAPELPKPDTIRLRDSIYDWCIDSVFIDTSKIVYKMPVDTGGMWITVYPAVEGEKYISTGEKAHMVFKVGTEAVLWNGEKAPVVVSVPKVKSVKADQTIILRFDSTGTSMKVDDDKLKKDSIANASANKKAEAKKVDDPVLLRNLRVVAVNEFGIEKARQTYAVSEDTCFICLEADQLYRLLGEVAVGVEYSPRRPLGDEQLQMSVRFEVRYKYLGKVTQVPDSNGWNRLSLGIAARANYGPFAFQVRPKLTPGLGLGWTVSIGYNFIKWAPKKGSNASKMRLPSLKV